MDEDTMYQDEEDEAGEPRSKSLNLTTTNYLNRALLYNNSNNWPSSRIIRVSRASGGKDRHSKVLTSKGLRDRRVRLSVSTAIQFYDLQDRLGYDQPSKAVEWLLNAASSSIDELPPISSPFFPDTVTENQMITSDEKSSRKNDHHKSEQMDMDVSNNSTAENNKSIINKGGSPGLSLSRSESRARARERAKERAHVQLADQTKMDEKKEDNCNNNQDYSFHQLLNPNIHVSRTTSFTELLSGAMNNTNGIDHRNYNSQTRQLWNHSYFTTHGLMGEQNRVCNDMKLASPESPNLEIRQHLSTSTFAPADPIVHGGGSCNDHHMNLINFEISSSSPYSGANSSSLGLNSGFNRGTLQSNSSSILSQSNFEPQLPQRFNPQDDFFLGTSMPVELNNHRFLCGFDDAGLQLCYGNNNAHAGHGSHKDKRKN